MTSFKKECICKYMNKKCHSRPDLLTRIGSECLALHVRKTARILGKAYDEVLAPCRLKNTQFSLLVYLKNCGPETMSEVAEFFLMDRTTLTRNLRPLERRELVSVLAGEDRRQRIISITPTGEALIEKAIPLWQNVQDRLAASLGQEGATALRAELATLARAAGD